MIEALGLSKQYGQRRAVREASFTVGTAEIVGLLGPNGAGKSTIMKILTCTLLPTLGSARISGDDVLTDAAAARACVGYVAENAPLYPDPSVREYLSFMGGLRGLRRSGIARGLERAVADCGLASAVDRRIGELSKGFRQRVAPAQALLHDPPVLILDEPTSGLDPQQIAEIRGLLLRLGVSKSVLLSSHILSEVEATCSRLLILSEGRIEAQGTREEIERDVGTDGSLALTVRSRTGGSPVRASLETLPGVRGIVSESVNG